MSPKIWREGKYNNDSLSGELKEETGPRNGVARKGVIITVSGGG